MSVHKAVAGNWPPGAPVSSFFVPTSSDNLDGSHTVSRHLRFRPFDNPIQEQRRHGRNETHSSDAAKRASCRGRAGPSSLEAHAPAPPPVCLLSPLFVPPHHPSWDARSCSRLQRWNEEDARRPAPLKSAETGFV